MRRYVSYEPAANKVPSGFQSKDVKSACADVGKYVSACGGFELGGSLSLGSRRSQTFMTASLELQVTSV